LKHEIDSEKLVQIILNAAEDKKAIDPVVLDIRRLNQFADFMVIVSGDSSPQLRAIAKEIEFRVKKLGIKGIVWEGDLDSGWLIFDTGSILAHVMAEDERAYYKLEELWGKEAIVFHG